MQKTLSAPRVGAGSARGGAARALSHALAGQPRSFIGFLAATLAFRLVLLGNPMVHVDEQFYQLVADRWAAGGLPYVTIWDRKPIGLFALYRLIGALPGDAPVKVQLCGAVATACTALVIQRLAAALAPARAASRAGLVYVLAMPAFSCAFGQAPVFYNLPMAMAALAVVRASGRHDTRGVVALGAGAMALVGLAMQIKYAAVFEGCALGMMLLARGWQLRWSWLALMLAATLWSMLALLPTAAAWACYRAIGHGDAFVEANFVSIFQRLGDGQASWQRLGMHALALLPFWLALFVAPRHAALPDPIDPRARTVLRLWALSAVAGYLVFGTWYDHYVAPMLAPLAVLSAPVFAAAPGARWYARLLVVAPAIGGLAVMGLHLKNHGTSAQFAAATQTIRSALHGGCFFMVDGEPRLYDSVAACIPTRYAFSSHLVTWTEAPAIGTDPDREMARIMLSHPDVVLIGDWTAVYLPNHTSRAIARDFLARDYQRYANVMLGTHAFGLYRLKR